MDPLISVVIPCYNYGQYVEETVDNVLASTHQSMEIIVVDDGSTDPFTIEILQKIHKKPKTKVIRRENGGLSAARNTGILNSKAPYILTLDADDLIDPTFIEKGLWLLEHNQSVSFVYPVVQLFGDQNRVWQTLPYHFFYLKFRNYIPATIIMRKSAWEKVAGYDESMRNGYEDWEFLIRLGKNGLIGLHMNEILFFYRKHAGSMLQGSKKRHRQLTGSIRKKHHELYSFLPLQYALFIVFEVMRRIKLLSFEMGSLAWGKIPGAIRETIKRQYFKLKPNVNPIVPIESTGNKWIRESRNELIQTSDRIPVLLVLPWLKVGGVERVFLELVTALHQKYEFIVVTTKSTHDQTWKHRFVPYVKAIYPIGDFGNNEEDQLRFLSHLITKYRTSILHLSNSQLGYRSLPYLKDRFPGLRVIETLHMEEPWSAWDYFQFSKEFESYMDRTVTLTESQASSLRKRLKDSNHPIEVIPNGIQPFEILPDRNRTDSKPFSIGFIGRLTTQKQPLLFLKALQSLKKRGILFHGQIIGEGEMKRDVIQYVRRWKLGDCIEIKDFAENIYLVLQDLDVLCIPSIREGLPMTGLEAMNAGVPIVATRVPGWTDLIDNGLTGILSDADPEALANAFLRLYQDPSLYKKIQIDARNKLRQMFTLEKMANGYDHLYEELANRFSGG